MNKNFIEKRLFNYSVIGAFTILLMYCVFCSFGKNFESVLYVIIAPVNGSIWESVKCIMLCFIIWSTATVLIITPPFKKFVVSAVFVLYIGLFTCITLYYLLSMFTGFVWWAKLVAVIFTVCLMQYLLFRLTQSDIKEENYFMLSVFLLVLLFVCIFSFSVFAPKLPIFYDNELGIYGVIPDCFDVGAVFLDKATAFV